MTVVDCFCHLHVMQRLNQQVFRVPTGCGATYGNQTWQVYTERKAP